MVAAAATAAEAAAVAVAMAVEATGLVGREVLAARLADKPTSAVHSVGRCELPLTHPKPTPTHRRFPGAP